MSLIAILEGGYAALAYLNTQGIYPDTVYFDFGEFAENSIYYDGADLLVMVQGLTDYTKVKLLDLFEYLRNSDTFKTVTVATNVDLGVLPIDSMYYFGDPMEGAFIQVPAGKHWTKVEGKRKRGLLSGFAKVYNNKDTEAEIYGEQYQKAYIDLHDDDLLKELKVVDLFA